MIAGCLDLNGSASQVVRARRERKLTVGMTVASWLLSRGTSAVSAASGASLQGREVILLH